MPASGQIENFRDLARRRWRAARVATQSDDLVEQHGVGRGPVASEILEPDTDAAATRNRPARHPAGKDVATDDRGGPGQPAVADDFEIGVKRRGARIEAETDARPSVIVVAPAEKVEFYECPPR
jgi:hypothetical protein